MSTKILKVAGFEYLQHVNQKAEIKVQQMSFVIVQLANQEKLDLSLSNSGLAKLYARASMFTLLLFTDFQLKGVR